MKDKIQKEKWEKQEYNHFLKFVLLKNEKENK